MKSPRLPFPVVFSSLLAISVTGFACGGAESGPNGTGGAPAAGSGGALGTGGQTGTGGASSGGASSTGGAPATGGAVGSGGRSATGGSSTGGAAAGGTGTGGTATGGSSSGGAGGRGTATGGANPGGAGRGGTATGGSTPGGTGGQGSTGTCTASTATTRKVTGTGPHQVVVETNSANGIKCGTIYRPADLTGTEKFPIFVWGEGGCSQDGYSNAAAMGEIASWGYFIVADGTPGSTNACAGGQDGKAFLDYLTWAIAENGKSCSAYYQKLETTKIAADGFSCGGLMAENVSGDPRFSAIGFTSSGLMAANATLYGKIHTPFKIMNGGSSDIAYENGLRDYEQISTKTTNPIVYFSKTSAGHGGDLGQARGDFNSVNLAWLNWQLKGDTGATGKAFLVGPTCKFCMNSAWVFKSANVP